MEGGNEANGVSGITHRRALTAEKTSPAVNLQRSRKTFPVRERKLAEEISREVRKVRKDTIDNRFAAEASNNLLNAESSSALLDRGCLSRRSFFAPLTTCDAAEKPFRIASGSSQFLVAKDAKNQSRRIRFFERLWRKPPRIQRTSLALRLAGARASSPAKGNFCDERNETYEKTTSLL